MIRNMTMKMIRTTMIGKIMRKLIRNKLTNMMMNTIVKKRK